MISNIKKIMHGKQKVAIIIKTSEIVTPLTFFTENEDNLQVGLHHKPSGAVLEPHMHTTFPRTIDQTNEVLYILSGKVKVTYYTEVGTVINTAILTTGDVLIHFKHAHGFEILEDARIFEVKQGPYPGKENAKVYVRKKNTRKRTPHKQQS